MSESRHPTFLPRPFFLVWSYIRKKYNKSRVNLDDFRESIRVDDDFYCKGVPPFRHTREGGTNEMRRFYRCVSYSSCCVHRSNSKRCAVTWSLNKRSPSSPPTGTSSPTAHTTPARGGLLFTSLGDTETNVLSSTGMSPFRKMSGILPDDSFACPLGDPQAKHLPSKRAFLRDLVDCTLHLLPVVTKLREGRGQAGLSLSPPTEAKFESFFRTYTPTPDSDPNMILRKTLKHMVHRLHRLRDSTVDVPLTTVQFYLPEYLVELLDQEKHTLVWFLRLVKTDFEVFESSGQRVAVLLDWESRLFIERVIVASAKARYGPGCWRSDLLLREACRIYVDRGMELPRVMHKEWTNDASYMHMKDNRTKSMYLERRYDALSKAQRRSAEIMKQLFRKELIKQYNRPDAIPELDRLAPFAVDVLEDRGVVNHLFSTYSRAKNVCSSVATVEQQVKREIERQSRILCCCLEDEMLNDPEVMQIAKDPNRQMLLQPTAAWKTGCEKVLEATQ